MLSFTLSAEMVQIIGRALGAQPYDAVASVVLELQKQINEQQAVTSTQPIPEQ